MADDDDDDDDGQERKWWDGIRGQLTSHSPVNLRIISSCVGGFQFLSVVDVFDSRREGRTSGDLLQPRRLIAKTQAAFGGGDGGF